MADEAEVRELEESCAAIVELASRKGSFIKRPEWGEINFERIEKDMEILFWIVERIKDLPKDILPQRIIQYFNALLKEARNDFNNIDTFTVSHGDASSLRDNIANKLSGHVQQIISGIGTWLPLLAFHAGEIGNWTSRIKDRSTQTIRFLQETESHITAQKEQIDESVRTARAAAGEAGAAEFTYEFRREAAAREKRSRLWLYPAALFSALALSLSVLVMFGLLGDTPTNVWEAVYGLGGRVIAISVLFYAAVWSGRIALANMNLASVNKHRAISLQTLQAFHKSAEDPAAKDAVVLEAARAVYENVPSGYIGRQATGPGAGARTLEVIRGANRGPRAADEG